MWKAFTCGGDDPLGPLLPSPSPDTNHQTARSPVPPRPSQTNIGPFIPTGHRATTQTRALDSIAPLIPTDSRHLGSALSR